MAFIKLTLAGAIDYGRPVILNLSNVDYMRQEEGYVLINMKTKGHSIQCQETIEEIEKILDYMEAEIRE